MIYRTEPLEEDYIAESSKYQKEIPNDIIKLLKELNSYDYGYINKNGEKIKKMNHFFEDYRSLTINEFEKYKIGVCWDYVHYEACWFKTHGYKYETYYIQVQDEDNDCPSHTYLIFYLPNSSKVYYFESSWGKYQGIEAFDNVTTLHNTIKDRHISNSKYKCDPKTFFRRKYNAESKQWEHLSCGDYMVKVSGGKIKINESYIEESISSNIDKDYKPKGKKSLSQFTKIKLSKESINKYKNTFKPLKHIRDNCEGYIYMDKQNPIAVIAVEEKGDCKFIQTIEIDKKYQGYGLSKQLLSVATGELKASRLSVNKKNKLAIDIYNKYGFKRYDETDTMIFMNINESYIEEMKRSELPKEVFGIPQERKYPMPDEQHVRSAIKFFNHVEPKYEKQLANNIIKKMKEYDIDGSCVGEKNRLKQYLPKSMLEQMIPDKPILVFDFGDVLVDCRYGVRAFTYTEPLLKELKRYGYKLYYLSNWDEESCKGFIQDGTFDFIKYFDGGVFSWELELEKPDDNIYKVFLYKYNLMAKDCLFFDDKHENIIAAKEVGMNAMQFNHAITPLYIITKFINKDGRSDLLEVLESSDMSFDSKEKHFTSPVSKRKFSANEDFLNRRSRPVKNQKAHQNYLKRKEKQNKTNNATAQSDMPAANQFGA